MLFVNPSAISHVYKGHLQKKHEISNKSSTSGKETTKSAQQLLSRYHNRPKVSMEGKRQVAEALGKDKHGERHGLWIYSYLLH